MIQPLERQFFTSFRHSLFTFSNYMTTVILNEKVFVYKFRLVPVAKTQTFNEHTISLLVRNFARSITVKTELAQSE